MAKKQYIPILGVDPGNSGAFCLTDGETKIQTWAMPVSTDGKDKTISFKGIYELLKEIDPATHVYLERAVPMAMGAKHAFNYGRGFAALEIAITLRKFRVTYVEPQKWAKEMHEGILTDLKPKAKSLIAAKRLYPKLMPYIPKRAKGGVHDGYIDALLIAGYGLRKVYGQPERDEPDFF